MAVLDEMLIDIVEVQQPASGNQKKTSKLDGPPKEESVLRNERAKKLLSEQKKMADVCLFLLFSLL